MLSDYGVIQEGDLKYIEESGFNQILATHSVLMTQSDEIRELRQRLVLEEEECIRRLDEEGPLMEEEVRVTGEEAELLKKKAEEAAQKKSEGDAVREKEAEERASREREEERVRRVEEARHKCEEDEITKRLEQARKTLELERVERHRPVLEAERIIEIAKGEKVKAESEAQANNQYKACFGKCNHPDCTKLKKEHFDLERYCRDPRVLSAAVANVTENLHQAEAAAAAARNNPSLLAADAKAKEEEYMITAEEAAFATKKAAMQKAAAAAAKEEAEARAKAAQQAIVAATEEAEAKSKADTAATAAVKKHAEAKAKADAATKDPIARSREAFFKRSAELGRVTGRLIYDDAATRSLIVGVQSRLEPNLAFSSLFFSCVTHDFPKFSFLCDKLPDGFAIDAETGVIEGTPVCPTSCQVKVTAIAGDSNGEIGVTIHFKIVAERAPSSLSFDAQAATMLIVGIETTLAPEPGFVAGVPAAKFTADNAATLAARDLEGAIRVAAPDTLVHAIEEVCDVYDEMKASVTALMMRTDRMRQLQDAMQQPFLSCPLPGEVFEAGSTGSTLSIDLGSQSLEILEKELDDLKTAQKSAAGLEEYAKAQTLKTKYEIKTQQVNEYRTFKTAYLDPLRDCCNEMHKELSSLNEIARRGETLLLTETFWTLSNELADAWKSVALELQKVSALPDVLLWLDLSSLASAAASGHQEILEKLVEFKSAFAVAMQQAGELWTQAMLDRQGALEQFARMQRLLGDTASKPFVMQQNVYSLAPQDLVNQLQQTLNQVPTRQMKELKDQVYACVESLTTTVSSSLHLLKKVPVLPTGVKLNETKGEITGTPECPVTNCVFTVYASNASGACSAVVMLRAQGQVAPEGLTYDPSIPAPSEFSNPPDREGLVLVGQTVSMEATCGHPGIPPGKFSVHPGLPTGIALNSNTGGIGGNPLSAVERKSYKVTCQNESGWSECTLSLEVQQHEPPGPLKYDSALCTSAKLHLIYFVGEELVINPTTADMQNHVIFSVSPGLSQG